MNSKKYYSDFLVIGTGIAGLSFAIRAAQVGSVHIVTKKKDFDSNTNYAQGGIASVVDPADSLDKHIDDTLKAGAGLCDPRAVELLVQSGPSQINELIEWGTHFSYKDDLSDAGHLLELGREGGHSHNRIVHAKDLTGREIERALLEKIKALPNVQIFEDHTAVDLLTEHQLKFLSTPHSTGTQNSITCYGAYILENSTGHVHIFNSKVTLIASGGAGCVYEHTTNPPVATGDGIAIAYRAGAYIADMEFMQFHPTSLYRENSDIGRSFLISEAVRGEGGLLYNSKGERFMEGVHPLKDLAPRDIVARAIDRELKRLGDRFVYLDISFRGKDFLEKRFPQIYAHCIERGIDIAKEPIPVVPAAHYLCGGIVSDLNGRSSINNLYVAGEAACTGVHGANRLASNSLLEAIVFSEKAFLHSRGFITGDAKNIAIPDFPKWNKEGTFDPEEWVLIEHDLEEIKNTMWDFVGIVRTNLRLKKAYRRILFLEEEICDYYKRSTLSEELIELRNLVTIARLIITGAMTRTDSVGLHYNTDYPEKDSVARQNVVQRTGEEPLIIDLTEYRT